MVSPCLACSPVPSSTLVRVDHLVLLDRSQRLTIRLSPSLPSSRPRRQVHLRPSLARHDPPPGVDQDALGHLALERLVRRRARLHHCPGHPLLRPGACSSLSSNHLVPPGLLTTYQPPSAAHRLDRSHLCRLLLLYPLRDDVDLPERPQGASCTRLSNSALLPRLTCFRPPIGQRREGRTSMVYWIQYAAAAFMFVSGLFLLVAGFYVSRSLAPTDTLPASLRD
jgi:hypothetical protein